MTFPDPADDRESAEPWSASDHDTTSAVLREWADEGIAASFRPGDEPATMRCPVCESISPAREFDIIHERRLEGASDPDDMVLGIAARCPVCHISGAIVLGYGADASEADSDIVADLQTSS